MIRCSRGQPAIWPTRSCSEPRDTVRHCTGSRQIGRSLGKGGQAYEGESRRPRARLERAAWDDATLERPRPRAEATAEDAVRPVDLRADLQPCGDHYSLENS